MNRINAISTLMVAVLLTNCSSTDNGSHQRENYKTITTFLQVDTLPKVKYMVETLDETGNTRERIRYRNRVELINNVEKYYYDSLRRCVLSHVTWFPENEGSSTRVYRFFYDSNNLISKSFSTFGLDTNTIYYEYYPNGKTQQTRTINHSDWQWEGITKFTYNRSDSLIREESWDLADENLQNRDSIVYTDTSKVVFKFHSANELSSKVETIYKDNKVVREVEYSVYPFSSDHELYVDHETFFEYKGNRLVRKMDRALEHTEWCGLTRPERIWTYTYLYD